MSYQHDHVVGESSLTSRVCMFLSCLILAVGTVAFVLGVLIRTAHESAPAEPSTLEPTAEIVSGAH